VHVFAENRFGVSTAAVVRVERGGATAADSFQIQPRLYVLSIGVAEYAQPQIDKLRYAAKDARDFAAAMQRQRGRMYSGVEARVLTNSVATRDAVLDGLDWLQRQVTQNDIGILYIAGHAVNDPTLGYTFLPQNADPERLRSTGVSMEEFRRALVAIPGKVLLFIDTCHSGNVLGRQTRALPSGLSGAIDTLASAESGIVVFSACTGRQVSYEDAAWGNGAFTKALIEGLDGQADYQKTGRITYKMLDFYVSQRVKELTGGRQSPVTQAPGGVPDYPVARVR
jgi:uncharacterized caspase-like protein